MTRTLIATVALLLSLCRPAWSQATKPATSSVEADVRTFELTPVPPPVPSMKYRLLYPFADRVPGNAAPLYAEAILLMGAGAAETADKAKDAYAAKDFKTFDQLADSLDLTLMFDQLEDAGRRTHCDWEPPIRERGVMTLLPHLQHLTHGVAKVVQVRALRQIEQGKVEDALKTLRLGYELADKINEPVLVSALVAAGHTRWHSDALAELMSRKESPNLYWALAGIPSRQPILRRAWEAESGWLYIVSPTLERMRNGENLSAEQWRKVLIDEMAPLYEVWENYRTLSKRARPDPIADATPENLRRAREAYAKAQQSKADGIDPAVALGHLYFQTWQTTNDEIAKCAGLSYAEALPRTLAHRERIAKLKQEQPANPFLEMLSDYRRVVLTYARTDRQLAALRAVEALRSYAAANGGKLPARLADVSDTPVPANPLTGQPFEYRVEGETATLSDPTAEAPMTYTIKIRTK